MACLALFGHLRAVTSLLAGSIIPARWRHWLLFPCGPSGTLVRIRCSPSWPYDRRRCLPSPAAIAQRRRQV